MTKIAVLCRAVKSKLLADKTEFYLYELTLNDFSARTGYTSAKSES